MDKFRRRTYTGLSEIIADMHATMSRFREIRPLMRGETIDPAFRERLMLTVTEVNGCRYCSYAHARQALDKGVSQEEIESLGKGMFNGSPDGEIPALLYAQHWAETNGQPDTEARERMIEQYGANTTDNVELALRMIRIGNLWGNTFDYILYRLSFGRWNPDK
ncbi:MAG: carboxymuconolactone decarboxylase family protein [Dehalococcoidia bacterium]